MISNEGVSSETYVHQYRDVKCPGLLGTRCSSVTHKFNVYNCVSFSRYHGQGGTWADREDARVGGYDPSEITLE